MSTQPPSGQPTEEELRRALEEEMRRVTIDDLLLQSAVSLINLGGRKAGLAPGTENERDLGQVKTAIDSVTALLPILEGRGREEARPIRDALSQLQMAYARLAGQPGAAAGGAAPGAETPPPSGAAPPSGKRPPAEETAPAEAPPPGEAPAPGEAPPSGEPPKPGQPGPAQRSGRLWVPGQ